MLARKLKLQGEICRWRIPHLNLWICLCCLQPYLPHTKPTKFEIAPTLRARRDQVSGRCKIYIYMDIYTSALSDKFETTKKPQGYNKESKNKEQELGDLDRAFESLYPHAQCLLRHWSSTKEKFAPTWTLNCLSSPGIYNPYSTFAQNLQNLILQ